MRRILFLLQVCFLSTAFIKLNAQCNAPIINAFSPNTGYIGSTVTITGANFDPIPANNQVFFGATQATVLTASFGVLTVQVPVGASTAPIAVKNGCNLIGYSSTAFNGIFCPTPITSSTYNNTAFQLTGIVGAYNMLAQDMDGDGKPDVVSAYNGVTVARNTSTPGTLSFLPFNFGTAGNYNPFISTADFDGDGKRDLFGTHNIYRNTSSGPGNINFSIMSFASVVAGGASGGYQNNVGDFNNDGKIDVVLENAAGTMFFYRNTSTGPGNISFAFAGSVAVTFRSTGIQCVDADGDGKTDVLSTQGDGNRMIALRNTTATNATTFTFAGVQAFNSGGLYPYRCQIADFDKDGKIDVATVNYFSPPNTVNTAIFRNTSTVGNISFSIPITYPGPVNNYRIGVGDVNGDGLPDIVTKSLAVQEFAVYANTSSGPGDISFAPRFDYSSAAMAEVSGIVIGDLDGDFVPDIATSGTSSNSIRFHRNTSAQVDNTPPNASCKNITVALSPSGTVNVTAAMVDNGSSDACGLQSILINNQPSVNFTCANIGPNTVTLKVTDRAGNVSSCQATVTVAPAAVTVTGQTTVCQGQTVTLTANQGDSYQWQKDGIDIPGKTSQTYVATETGNYSVTVTNAGGCSGTSAPVAITVNNNPTVSVTPSGSASLCPPNSSLLITASTSSIYQWKKDGDDIPGATQQTYNATTAGTYSVQVIDLFGCSATSSPLVVSATDNILPTAKCKNATVAINANGTAGITVTDIDDGSFDNCGVASIAITSGKTAFTCADAGQTFSVELTVTDNSGNTNACTAQVTVTDLNSVCNRAPVAICKPVTIFADGNCQGTAPASAFDGGSSDPDNDQITLSVSPAGPYAIGTTNVTLTVADNKGGVSTCSTTVTVTDNTAPVITHNGNKSVNNDEGKCGAAVSVSASATDNCTVGNPTGVRSDSKALTDDYSVGTTTITWNVTDENGNAATPVVQTVTVSDITPPTVVTQNIAVTLNSGGTATIAAAQINNGSSDNCTAAGNLQLALDKSSFGCGDVGAPVTVNLTVIDASGNSASGTAQVTVVNNAPVITSVTPSTYFPVSLGTAVNATTVYSDVNNNITSAKLNWDDGTIQNITSGTALSHTYGTTGVYTLTATVTDPCGSDTKKYDYVVVYDPNGGFTTGGGWIDSKPGAYTADPSLGGKANFGFVSKYLKGATLPTGNTEFQFHAGSLNFNSTKYEWLVISGAIAQFKGTGTINGSGNYGFLVSAVDGQVSGGGGVDKFRIKIWDKSITTGNNVVYDNQIGASDNDVATTAIAGGSIMIQAAKAGKTEVHTTSVSKDQDVMVANKLRLSATPNPSRSHFNVILQGASDKSANLRVIDASGRVVEVRRNISANGTLRIGENYRTGVYIVEVQQGTEKATMKLLKGLN